METPDRLPVLAADPPLSDDQLDRVAVSDPQDADYTPFAIVEVSVAEWAMRKVAQARDDVAKAHLAAETWHNEIEEWLKRVTARASTSAQFLIHHLEQYALDQRAMSGGREKTVYLPSGEISTATYQPRIVVTDEAKLIAWCEEGHPFDGIVKVAKSILVSELRKHVEIKDGVVIDPLTGEIVPGVEVEHGHTTAKVVPR